MESLRRLRAKTKVTVTVSEEDLGTLDKAYGVAKDIYLDLVQVNRENTEKVERYLVLMEKASDAMESIYHFIKAYEGRE